MAFKVTIAFLAIACLAIANARSAVKIVGGEEAEPHEFPYQVSIMWNYRDGETEPKLFCAGSLLNEYHVLTAAHCKIFITIDGYFEVVAAEHDTTDEEGSEQRRRVKKFFIHENFEQDENSPDDIGIIRVDKPFELNEKVRPVRLPQRFEEFDGDVTLSGWGSISTTASPEYPDKLRKVVLPIVDFETCQKYWNYTEDLARTNICAGPTDGSKTACSSDSGGPLVKQLDDGEVVQIGVVSWGAVPCGEPFRPTVFAGVAHYIDWIEDKFTA